MDGGLAGPGRLRLGVARGTVQARLDKLTTTGVVTAWGPELSPAALGYPVTAFLTLEIRQETSRGGHDVVGAHLAAIPEVLEAHTITGAGDMWARVVGSIQVHGIEALANVAAKGDLASALGEGFADGLDVAGF